MRACGVLVLLCACGEGSTPPVEAIDAAAPADALCGFPPGRTYITQTLRMAPADQDNDGVIDSMVSMMPDAIKAQAYAEFDEATRSGELIMLLHLTDWYDPPTPDDPDLGLHVWKGWDADMPVNPANNFSGDAAFLVLEDQFDLNCQSRNAAENVRLAGGVLTATRSDWAFELSTGTGKLVFSNATLVATFDADYTHVHMKMDAICTFCALDALAFPGDFPGSTLDAFINEPSIASVVIPDVDVDGDGLEQVVGDGVSILYCLDGDGTPIDGQDCACHPAIADAYSCDAEYDFVLAHIVGVADF